VQATFVKVRKDWRSLEFIPFDLQSKDLVLEAVRQDWGALQYARQPVSDPELLREAICQSPLAVQFASDELRGDRNIIMQVVEQNGLLLEEASESARADQDIVLTAVCQNGMALKYAADSLRNSLDIVVAAVEEAPLALGFANDRFLENRELVFKAVSSNWHVYGLLSCSGSTLAEDVGVATEALRQSGNAFELLPETLKCRKELILEAARSSKSCSMIMECLEADVLNDKELLIQLLGMDGMALQHAPLSLRQDHDVCIAALSRTRRVKALIPEVLWQDPAFCEAASRAIEASASRSRLRSEKSRSQHRSGMSRVME
jgi:hypothetical protein